MSRGKHISDMVREYIINHHQDEGIDNKILAERTGISEGSVRKIILEIPKMDKSVFRGPKAGDMMGRENSENPEKSRATVMTQAAAEMKDGARKKPSVDTSCVFRPRG